MTMNATFADFSAAFAVPSARRTSPRIEAFIRAESFDRPTLVLDIDAVEAQYRGLKAGLGRADIHYAVKANPAREIIERLVNLGSHFDAASRGEIELCLSLGARPDTISFGNTVKRASDIAFAHAAGITLFAADAEEELEKIAEHAPGAQVYIRLIVEASGADWPLTRKFGTARDKVLTLMGLARDLGLAPVGLSFHVDSQTRDPAMWENTLDQVAAIWNEAREAGFALDLLNIGGGFPAFYGDDIPHPTLLCRRRHGPGRRPLPRRAARHGGAWPRPCGRGRHDRRRSAAGQRKSDDDLCRWVYLDIGKFSGLAETMDEAIRYQFVTDRDHETMGPCILAGPSCDSADVLYEKRPVTLPLGLKSGDRVIIRNCGAYTSSYSSVGFNGFPPLDVVVI
jgi:ornithine decarboxylase